MSDPLAASASYACVYLVQHEVHGADVALLALAQNFSPRYECHGMALVTIDISGLDRLLGDPRAIGEEIRRSALVRGLRVHIGIAATRTSAQVMALTRPGITIVARGEEGRALAPIPIAILGHLVEQPPSLGVDPTRAAAPAIAAFTRWGVKTLGALAALPADALAARLGQGGLRWQAMARGQDARPLVPALAEERFASSMDLEWPIEGLEPLSFVLTRLLEPLSTRLERRDRGAAVIHVTLGLVALPDLADDTYTRSVQLPSPIRDVRTLRTLLLLDLESHPPAAPIERVTILIDPTPGRVLQHALFVRAHPTPEQMSTLIARLNALMGEDRIGRPVQVDSYRPGAFAMEPFPIHQNHQEHKGHQEHQGRKDPHHTSDPAMKTAEQQAEQQIVSALRRYRRPVPARVKVETGAPVAVSTDRHGFAGGRVLEYAGPWRTAGAWWEQSAWDRDEWDVSLSDGAVYRIFQDRATNGWFIDAVAD